MKVAFFSDVHGHLRLLLRLIGNWQHAHAIRLDAAMVAGDLGAFPDPSKFDRATKRWIERDPEEAGFAKYFASPVAEVEHLFAGEFGVKCPILFVPGNHEDFDHITSSATSGPAPGAPDETFPVDCYKRFSCIRDGAIVELHGHDEACLRIAGIWGIEKARQGAPYKINASVVHQLAEHGRNSFDLLLTHDVPAEAYPHGGSPLITQVIRSCEPSIHLFGHVHARGIHEFALPGFRTKSFLLNGVSFHQRKEGLIGSMGLLDWDGATARVKIVRDDWLLQMRLENWEHFTPEPISSGG